jgi:hypothetical protein
MSFSFISIGFLLAFHDITVDEDQGDNQSKYGGYDNPFILFNVADKNKNNLPEKISYYRNDDAPPHGIDDIKKNKLTHLHVRAAEEDQYDRPDAHQKPYEEDDKVTVFMDDLIRQRDLVADKLEPFNKILAKIFSEGKKGKITDKGADEGIEHNHA